MWLHRPGIAVMEGLPTGRMTHTLDPFGGALGHRYRIDQEIGAGGMATVYLAHDLKHDRPVALKVLRPELGVMLGAERFIREIGVTARLQHPHILPLLDSGEAAGRLFFVMPYVEGESLRQRLEREKQLPIGDAIRLTIEVAEALDYSHQHGFVHRDIKPENILLSQGHALVADFGIALAVTQAGEGRITEAGLSLGTPTYMSPEQAASSNEIDGRSDVYSLGCVLYEMLAGDPPYTGRTVQAIMARQANERPRSLRVVRPMVPPPVERAVAQALALLPADRFDTGAAFATALATARQQPRWTRRHTGIACLLAGAGLLGVLLSRFVLSPAPPLDPNKVVVFPLAERPVRAQDGLGEQVALLIGSALEHTEPLKWLDGWTWLDRTQRADASLVGNSQARQISRRQGARYYLNGETLRRGDSATVVLRLHDAGADSVLGRASATVGLSEAPEGGLRAVNDLLPLLLARGRRIDLRALEGRRPGAVVAWLQGERAYRQSQFAEALAHYRSAVEQDSALAVAALKGAWAAHWEHQEPEALQFVDIALTHSALLSPRYQTFALGLHAYLTGAADSASARFRRITAADPRWVEAVMGQGEVFYHLLPRDWAPDSAEHYFTEALRLEPEFAPAQFHLAESALRVGNVDRAERLIESFRRQLPDTLWLTQLDLMLRCVREGPAGIDWVAQTAQYPNEVVLAAKVLAPSWTGAACGAAAARAVLKSPRAEPSHRWGASLLLQSLLAAQRDLAGARSILEAALGSGVGAAFGLYMVDALAGASLDPTREAEAAAFLGAPLTAMPSGALWWRGRWEFHRGNTAQVQAVASELASRARTAGSPENQVMADAMAGWAALSRADTTETISQFSRLQPTAPAVDLAWGLWESLPAERMALVELLTARGRAEEAYRVAESFDHPQPVINLLYLPRSLALRVHAAEQLGRGSAAEQCRARLLALGRADLLESSSQSVSTRKGG